jgi:hypothetical protein
LLPFLIHSYCYRQWQNFGLGTTRATTSIIASKPQI